MASRPSMSINLGLPAAPEVDTPELYGALLPVYNAIKNTMYAVDAYTGNSQLAQSEYDEVSSVSGLLTQKTALFFVKLSETVTAGTILNLHSSGGTRARKALLPSQPAQAFAVIGGSVGETVPVCLLGLCTQIGGLTAGTVYYQSAVGAGLITATATAQRVGFALDTSKLWFSPS